MPNCTFCQIAKGEIPAHKVFEDADTVAFLDIQPISRGHTLVISKGHIPELFELGNDLFANLMNVCQQVARQLKHRLGATRVNIQTVAEHFPDHLHIHLVPVYGGVEKPSKTDDLATVAKEISG